MDGKEPSSHRDEHAVEPESALEHTSEGDERLQIKAARVREMQAIKDDADQRDDRATARDVISDNRDQIADLKAFLDPGPGWSGHGQRRAAAVDRSHAKDDREASADDREQLTKEANSPSDS